MWYLVCIPVENSPQSWFWHCLVAVVTCGLAMLQAPRIYEVTFVGKRLVSVQTLAETRASAHGVRRAALGSVREGEASQRSLHDATLSSMKGAMSRYERLAPSPEGPLRYDTRRSAHLDSDAKHLALSESGDVGFCAARSLAAGEPAALFAHALRPIEQDLKLNRDGATVATAQAETNYHSAIALIGVLRGTALLSVAVAWSGTRSIVTPIGRTVVFGGVARGDLGSDIEVSGRYEAS